MIRALFPGRAFGMFVYQLAMRSRRICWHRYCTRPDGGRTCSTAMCPQFAPRLSSRPTQKPAPPRRRPDPSDFPRAVFTFRPGVEVTPRQLDLIREELAKTGQRGEIRTSDGVLIAYVPAQPTRADPFEPEPWGEVWHL